MPAPRNRLTSKLFWQLMDRWSVPDDAALRLLGHHTGLTAQGKRPRFTLTPAEEHRLTNLLAIERLLIDVQSDASGAWLRRAQRSGPVAGVKPLDFMVRSGQLGIDRTRRLLEEEAFRKSV